MASILERPNYGRKRLDQPVGWQGRCPTYRSSPSYHLMGLASRSQLAALQITAGWRRGQKQDWHESQIRQPAPPLRGPAER